MTPGGPAIDTSRQNTSALDSSAPARRSCAASGWTPLLRARRLELGIALYALAAAADVAATLMGIGGNPALEGNPILRATMQWLGPAPGLVLQKAIIGAVAVGIAKVGEGAIRRGDPWIWRIPMTRWVRRWMRRGDRSWIAFIPLYAAALAQGIACASWLAVARLI
jgi:hypothetical protein